MIAALVISGLVALSGVRIIGYRAVTPADFSTMWAHIRPDNGMNVTVVIRDV